MKLGIVITTYNRPYYLRQCLDSLKNAVLPENTTLLFVDDASDDDQVRSMIENYKTSANKYAIFLETNQKVHVALRKGFDYLFDQKCDLVMNLDADAFVSVDFVKRLTDLKKQHPNFIVSGFNTLTPDPVTKKPRHPVLKVDYPINVGCCLKHSIGGINILIDKNLYDLYVAPSLDKGYGWDWKMSESVKKSGSFFVVATPSCIDHIGIDSTFDSHVNPDKAADFLLTSL